MTTWTAGTLGAVGDSLAADYYGSWNSFSAPGLYNGAWHQVALTHSAGTTGATAFKAYLDGVALADNNDGGNQDTLNVQSGPLRIGYWVDTAVSPPSTPRSSHPA